MAITDLEAAQEMAEKYPDLHESRQRAFGQNYLQDLEQGTGTSQYYTGFGLVPDWVTGAIGAPAAQETAPVVQDPMTGDAQVAQQIAAQDRGDGITGASVVQPSMDQAGAVAAMTPNQAYSIPGEMPKTPVSGAWGPMDYLQNETVTPPITDQAGAIAAMTQPEAYSLPGESDPFLASGAAGGARLPATQYTTTLPSGDVFATDDPMLQEKIDYTEKTPAWWESARDKFVTTGQDVSGFFGDLKDKGIDVGQIAIGSLMNMIQPGLSLLAKAIPKETSEDVWNKQFAVGGKNYNELVAQDQELGERLGGYYEDLRHGNLTGQDPFGRNTVSAFGDYEKALAEDLQYTGTNQFNLDKQAYAQAYFDKKGIGLNPNEAKAFEEKYGISPTGELVTAEERKEGLEELSDIYSGIGKTRDGPTVDDTKPDNLGDVGFTYDDLASQALGEALHGGPTIDDTRPDNLGEVGFTKQDLASQNLGQSLHGEGGGNVSYGGPDSGANVEAASGDVYGGAAYGYDEAAEKGNEGGGGGGGGKIVCTMMNDSYGFGSFRNKIWLRQSKNLAPEYQIGYHKIFLPLVRLSKTNKLLKKTLEHIAVHRTIDIRQEARGKKHLLGRIYRKILEPICYIVGKYAKR